MNRVSEKPEALILERLRFDYDLYPRNSVDYLHVGRLAEAIKSGENLPPLVVEEGRLRVVDGFHRAQAYERVFGKEYEVEVDLWSYKDNVEFFLHATRLNATHGKELSTYDKAHVLVISERLKIEPKLVRKVLCITPETAKKIMENRAETRAAAPVPLKHGLQYLRGRVLNERQTKAIPRLHGKGPIYHADQLISMMENDLMPEITVRLSEKLARLKELLEKRGY